MKRRALFLAEMTNRELEIFLEDYKTVLIPVGSTEQHGPHSPLGTDVIIPQEIARRVAEKIDAVVAPPISYALSYPHRSFAGEFSLSIETFMALIRDLAISFAKSGFKRIVFLNGHFDNTCPANTISEGTFDGFQIFDITDPTNPLLVSGWGPRKSSIPV